MLKLILCAVISAASLYVGFVLSSRLTERVKLLERYIGLLDESAGRIEFSSVDLAAAFSRNFAGFSFAAEKPFSPQWERFITETGAVLHSDDIDILKGFAQGMGEGDTESQLRHIGQYKRRLTLCLDTARKDVEQKSSVYRILPFAVGLALVILLI